MNKEPKHLPVQVYLSEQIDPVDGECVSEFAPGERERERTNQFVVCQTSPGNCRAISQQAG